MMSDKIWSSIDYTIVSCDKPCFTTAIYHDVTVLGQSLSGRQN